MDMDILREIGETGERIKAIQTDLALLMGPEKYVEMIHELPLKFFEPDIRLQLPVWEAMLHVVKVLKSGN